MNVASMVNMENKRVIPTIFSHNLKEFNLRFNKLYKTTKNLQIDLMDGKFVKNKSVSLSQIPNLNKYNKYKINFEVHLMVKNPEKYISKLREKGFDKVIFHYNSGDNVKSIALIKKEGMTAFLAVNPEDKIKEVSYLFDLVDGILLMGVHPGKENQQLINSTYKKIMEIRKINKNMTIQIDGGVNASNIKRLSKCGAMIFNTGSFVSKSEFPRQALGELYNKLKS